MNVPPPEGRKCKQCLNTITLNLFRLNSEICRYCEDGLPFPERLLKIKDEKIYDYQNKIDPIPNFIQVEPINTEFDDNNIELIIDEHIDSNN